MAAGNGNINRLTTSEAVARRLRAEIQRNVIHPGTRLRQGDVASRFGVSTTPVREAFALLQADGLLRIDAHRGAIVSRPSMDDVRESFQIREALEGLAISSAIRNFDGERLRSMQALLDDMKTTTDIDRWIDLNHRFHLISYEPAAKPQLLALIETLRESAAVHIHLYASNHFPGAEVAGEHQAILDACRRQDAKAAKAAVRRHLRHTRDSLISFIQGSDEQ